MHRLVAERHRLAVVEHQAAQPPLDAALARGQQRLAADEVALVELDAEADAALLRRLVGRDVGAPDPVALLQPQRVDRAVAAGHEPVRLARPPRASSHSAAPYSVGQ